MYSDIRWQVLLFKKNGLRRVGRTHVYSFNLGRGCVERPQNGRMASKGLDKKWGCWLFCYREATAQILSVLTPTPDPIRKTSSLFSFSPGP